jgi:hypothetical protein
VSAEPTPAEQAAAHAAMGGRFSPRDIPAAGHDLVLRTLVDVLRQFTEHGHPGRPCLRTPWIREATIAGWWAVVRGVAPVTGSGDNLYDAAFTAAARWNANWPRVGTPVVVGRTGEDPPPFNGRTAALAQVRVMSGAPSAWIEVTHTDGSAWTVPLARVMPAVASGFCTGCGQPRPADLTKCPTCGTSATTSTPPVAEPGGPT